MNIEQISLSLLTSKKTAWLLLLKLYINWKKQQLIVQSCFCFGTSFENFFYIHVKNYFFCSLLLELISCHVCSLQGGVPIEVSKSHPWSLYSMFLGSCHVGTSPDQFGQKNKKNTMNIKRGLQPRNNQPGKVYSERMKILNPTILASHIQC